MTMYDLPFACCVDLILHVYLSFADCIKKSKLSQECQTVFNQDVMPDLGISCLHKPPTDDKMVTLRLKSSY